MSLNCYYCGTKDIDPGHSQLKHNFTSHPSGFIDTVIEVKFWRFACTRCVNVWKKALNELRIPKVEEFNHESLSDIQEKG